MAAEEDGDEKLLKLYGLVVSMNPLGQMIFSPISGIISNKMGSIRLVCLVTSGLYIFGNLLYAILSVFPENSRLALLIIARLATGIASSCTVSPESGLASTILYNYARIVHIFRAFEDPDAVYPDLTALDQIDFSLLKEREEWELLFDFVLPYEEMLGFLVQDLLLGRGCRIQKVVQHLSGLAMAFSKYYNRVHVLKDPSRPQLFPTMFARIHLLRALRHIFQDAFHLLGVEPLNNM